MGKRRMKASPKAKVLVTGSCALYSADVPSRLSGLSASETARRHAAESLGQGGMLPIKRSFRDGQLEDAEQLEEHEWEIEVHAPFLELHRNMQQVQQQLGALMDVCGRPVVSSAASEVLQHAAGRRQLHEEPGPHRVRHIRELAEGPQQQLCRAIHASGAVGTTAARLDDLMARGNGKQHQDTMAGLDAVVADAARLLHSNPALRQGMLWEARVIDAYPELKRLQLISVAPGPGRA